jgi:DNA-binding CsgD family transcriptional regulator
MYRDAATGAYGRADVARFQSLCEQFRLLLDIAGQYRLARTLAHLSLRALDHLDFGVMLLDADGAVLEMNRFARNLAGGDGGLRVRNDRLEALDARANVGLRSLLAGSRNGSPATATLAPPAVPTPVTLALTSMADPGGGQLLFLRCPERAVDERLWLLVDRFAFTPVELQLARGLLQGLDLRRAGAAAGLSYETSRWYLKQLFAKTDTHRQADLVRLLLATKSEIHLPPAP